MRTAFSDLIIFRKNKHITNIYDLEFDHIPDFKGNSSVECHVVLYPYSRNISRNDYSFNPFEEYVKDLSKNQKSAYTPIRKPGKYLFGIFLGLMITLFLIKYNIADLISAEAIVGILGAYFIGKDLWYDIDGLIALITKNWFIRYQQPYYSYRLDKNSTMTQYSHFAKKHRYEKHVLLPSKMEFIEEHNSSTARMYFDMEDIRNSGDSAHILSISMKPEKVKEFERDGYMLGTKISLNKRFLFFDLGTDMFQSLSQKNRGCLDSDGKWLENTAFYRKTLIIGKLKIFLKKGYIKDIKIIA